MGWLVVLLLGAGLIAGLYLLHGFALFHLWRWFMVPLGLPAVSLPWAIGIGLLVGYLTNHTVEKKGDQADGARLWASAILRPILALGIGWLLQYIWGPFS